MQSIQPFIQNLASLRWTDWVAYGTATFALHQLYKFVRICLSDADLQAMSPQYVSHVNRA